MKRSVGMVLAVCVSVIGVLALNGNGVISSTTGRVIIMIIVGSALAYAIITNKPEKPPPDDGELDSFISGKL